MTIFLTLFCRVLLVCALAVVLSATEATAQTPGPAASSLTAAAATVPAGAVVHVTDQTGATIKGTFTALSGDAIQVVVNRETRTMAASQIRRIRWQQRDSPWSGVLIGAGIGAAPGIYYLITDPNECTGLCPEEYALIGIGAVVGGLIDWAVKKKVTIYERPAAAVGARGLVLAPVVAVTRGSIHLGWRF